MPSILVPMEDRPDTLHHLFTLGNCSEADLQLLADFDIPGAETELSSRLAAQRLLVLQSETQARRKAKVRA